MKLIWHLEVYNVGEKLITSFFQFSLALLNNFYRPPWLTNSWSGGAAINLIKLANIEAKASSTTLTSPFGVSGSFLNLNNETCDETSGRY
ncbi:MAG: hypothetical protein ACTS6G_03855 [Candidatus Hodgkinia cicadicola]